MTSTQRLRLSNDRIFKRLSVYELGTEREMNSLIELRQRSRGYEPVSTEDDYEAVPPMITSYQPRKDIEDILHEIQQESSYFQDLDPYDRSSSIGQKKKKSNLCMFLCIYLLIILPC